MVRGKEEIEKGEEERKVSILGGRKGREKGSPPRVLEELRKWKRFSFLRFFFSLSFVFLLSREDWKVGRKGRSKADFLFPRFGLNFFFF